MNALKINKIRCILAIIFSSLIVILTFIGMMYRFFYFEGTQEGTSGISSFRMFTILSNFVVAICSSLSIPYQIDGLRNNNYHLPRWIVDTLYLGVTCVSITFLISLSILSPVMGFSKIMFEGTNVLFHLICPILSIISFIFLNSYHDIKFYKNFIAIVPMVIYLIVYSIMVYAIGSWDDFYKLNQFIPAYVTIPLAIPVGFLVALILRVSHNKVHNNQKNNFFKYFLESEEYSHSLDEAIKTLAKTNKFDLKGDLSVPRRIISVLMKRYGESENIEIYLKKYIDEYYK